MSSHVLFRLGIAALAAAVAVVAFYFAREAYRERSAVKGAPDATAGTLRAGQGPVEIEGTAHAAEHSFTSPLTKQECVAYRFVKEEKQKKRVTKADGQGTRTKYEWVTIHDEESGAPFWVDDGTGRTLVDGSTADLDMERSYEVHTDDVKQGVGEKVVASVKGLVGGETSDEGHEIPQQYVEELKDTNHGKRFKEWLVHEGEQVYVYGEAVRPEQTPMGSGVGGEMSSMAGAIASSGGFLGMLKRLAGVGKEAATNPQTRYKPRAVQRLPDGGSESVENPVDEETHQEMQEQAKQMQETDDPQQRQEQMSEMMGRASEMFQQAGAAAQDQLPDTPVLDQESVVVSWGQQAPTFVVSDQGKGSVLRDYSTGVAKYAITAIVAAAIAIGSVGWAFNLV